MKRNSPTVRLRLGLWLSNLADWLIGPGVAEAQIRTRAAQSCSVSNLRRLEVALMSSGFWCGKDNRDLTFQDLDEVEAWVKEYRRFISCDDRFPVPVEDLAEFGFLLIGVVPRLLAGCRKNAVNPN